MTEIEIKGNKTVKELVEELELTAPFLFEVGGEVFYPDENYAKVLQRGDIVTLIPIIGGG